MSLAYAPRGGGQGRQAYAGPCLGVRLRGRFVGAITAQSAPSFNERGTLGTESKRPPGAGRFVRRFEADSRWGWAVDTRLIVPGRLRPGGAQRVHRNGAARLLQPRIPSRAPLLEGSKR